MNDSIDVRTVDAHSERVGTHDVQRTGGKRVLDARALVVLEPRMIRGRFNSAEPASPRPSSARVAAYTSARRPRRGAAASRAFVFVIDSFHAQVNVGAIESGNEDSGESRPASATMSSRTSGVAVAVNAAMGGRRADSVAQAGGRGPAQPPIVGPKVVPHCDTQCARRSRTSR